MSEFKSFSSSGLFEVARWKSLDAWPDPSFQEDCVELHGILSNLWCSSLHDEDLLAWSPNPKGFYTVSSRYQVLLSHRMAGEEV